MDRYEEALALARQGKSIEEIFPELCESEDERVRKWIIDELHLHLQRSVGDKERCDELSGAIAWLKKQKEQKPRQYISEKYVFAIMSELTNLSFSELIPIGSDEYKKIQEITSDVRRLLDYPIEQKPAEWSEEDRIRKELLEYLTITRQQDFVAHPERQRWLAYLEKQKEQKSSEWSEEDQKMLKRVLEIINRYGTIPRFDGKVEKRFNKEYIWLKALPERLKSIRPYWKPNKEQMEALHTVCYVPELDVYGGLTDWLKELYEQLKALM